MAAGDITETADGNWQYENALGNPVNGFNSRKDAENARDADKTLPQGPSKDDGDDDDFPPPGWKGPGKGGRDGR